MPFIADMDIQGSNTYLKFRVRVTYFQIKTDRPPKHKLWKMIARRITWTELADTINLQKESDGKFLMLLSLTETLVVCAPNRMEEYEIQFGEGVSKQTSEKDSASGGLKKC